MLYYFEKFQELICIHSKECCPHMTVFRRLIVLEFSNYSRKFWQHFYCLCHSCHWCINFDRNAFVEIVLQGNQLLLIYILINFRICFFIWFLFSKLRKYFVLFSPCSYQRAHARIIIPLVSSSQTTSAEESGMLDFFAVPIVSFSSDFLWILPPCPHLPSGKCWNLLHKRRNGLVSLLSPSPRRDFGS